MDQEISVKLEILEKKIDATFVSAEKTRKYFLWTLVAAVIGFVLPLIGLLFAIPFYLNTLQGLGAF